MSLLLYGPCVNLKRHVIALLYRYELAIVVVETCGGDNPAGGMMKITPVRWIWRSKARRKRLYHVTYYELHVMLILFTHLILLVRDGRIIR